MTDHNVFRNKVRRTCDSYKGSGGSPIGNYEKKYGPGTLAQCNKWIDDNCKEEGGTQCDQNSRGPYGRFSTTIQSEVGLMTKTYRGHCKTHDWLGMAHYRREDAIRDLDAHIVQEDGNHDGEILEEDLEQD